MTMKNFLTLAGAALLLVLAVTLPALAGDGPPEGKGNKKGDVGMSVEGFLYGDLYVMERDGNGQPFIYEEGDCVNSDMACAQPLMSDCSYVPLMCQYEGDWRQDQELIDCLIANGVTDPLGEIDPENLWEPELCDIHPCFLESVQEVHFGRMSVARTTTDVILKAYDEALSSLNSALGVGQDLAGRIVLDLPVLDEFGDPVIDADGFDVTYEKTIDSPLENLSLYREMMINSCLGGVEVEFIGEGGETHLETHYLEEYAVLLLEKNAALEHLVCDFLETDRDVDGWWETPITPAYTRSPQDHDLAATFLAGAGDKSGHITLDMVINVNTYLGINPYTEPTQGDPPIVSYHEFTATVDGSSWYQYNAATAYGVDESATLLAPAGDDCTGSDCYCVATVSPFGSEPALVDFANAEVSVCRGGEMFEWLCRVDALNSPDDIMTEGWLGENSLLPGCGGANWFAQAAEDAREVIWFLHNWAIPEYEVPDS